MPGSMEFLSINLINTTSLYAVASGTATAQYLIDRNVDTKYQSSGIATTTAVDIVVTLPNTATMSHAILRKINAGTVQIFADTTTNILYSMTSNVAQDLYAEFSATTVKVVTVRLNNPFTGTDKYIGELGFHTRLLEFERNPSADDYKPSIFRKQIEHEMPDGGIVLFNVRDKFRAKLSWDFITGTFYNSLLDIYETGDPFVFVPFPTMTAWDGKAHEVVWPGQFDFKHSTNDKVQGYSGSITLKETPNA